MHITFISTHERWQYNHWKCWSINTKIALVQQRPTIYNNKDKQHSNPGIQENWWTEIVFGFSLFSMSYNKDNKIGIAMSSSSEDMSKFKFND